MITILAEKPSVAKDISNVLNATKRNDGYFSNQKYNVTWSYGHLVTLGMPKEYGIEEWSLNNLPILPQKFKLVAINDKDIKKQLKVISNLFNNSDKIIVATDAGREGELIFRLIYSYLNTKNKNVERLWISDLTPETIKEGFNNLKPITDYNKLYYSAMARACADWMVGINFTQAMTISSKKNYAISIGRVQTPTLKIIVDRFISNRDFISTNYYTPALHFQHKGNEFSLISEVNYNSKEKADNTIQIIPNTFNLTFDKTKKNNNAPLLYDLTALQKDAFASFKFTAQQTLDIAQSLYENKLITYPRTDSRYLAKNQINNVFKLVTDVLTEFNFDKTDDFIDVNSIDKSINFNNAKISDHHAIIPTANFKQFKNVQDKEIKLFYLIAKRFIESFSRTGINSSISVKTSLNGSKFIFNNNITEFLGWRYFTNSMEDKFADLINKTAKVDETNYDFLFDCENGNYDLRKTSIQVSKTKAPNLLNDASLLTAMENSGKLIDDEVEEVMTDKGLGTPATRASIIEVLIKREYIERVKNAFIPTDLGISLITSLKDYNIVSAEYTGKMEYRLNMIEKGTENLNEFMRETKEFVGNELSNIVNAGTSMINVKSESEIVKDFSFGKCPKCRNGDIKKSKKGAYCSNFKNESSKCDFFIFKKMASKSLSEKNIKDLINKGKTTKIKGFKSKAGKAFEALVSLDKEYKTKFEF